MKRPSTSSRAGPSGRPLKKRRPSPSPSPALESEAESQHSVSSDDEASHLEAGSSSQSSATSSRDEENEDDAEDEEDEESIRAAQLAALARHQAAFLSSSLPTRFQPDSQQGKSESSTTARIHTKGKGKQRIAPHPSNRGDEIDVLFSGDLEVDDGEFSDDSGSDSSMASGEGFDEDDGEEFGLGGVDDVNGVEGDVAKKPQVESKQEESRPVPTVVFAPQTNGRSEISKADRKRFMSAKSTKMMDEDGSIASASRGHAQTAEEEDDQHHVALDKTLQHLLLTKLLPEAAGHARPVEKRNAIAGRLLELAAIAPQGQGTSSIREKSYSSQPRKLQTAIVSARAARSEKTRAEAEAAGSWVRGIGGLGDAGKKPAGKKDKRGDRDSRDRGISGGVGRFKGGILTLSKAEVERGSKVDEPWDGGKKKKGGRGGKGGGRGGRGGKR